MRVGGFGGADGLSKFLEIEKIDGVIDATHPFASQMSQNAFEACSNTDTELLQLLRPAWPEKPGWTVVPDFQAAADALCKGAHVFLATGRASLDHFSDRDDVKFTARVIDHTDDAFPLPDGQFLVSRPPFSVQDEMATLKRLGVSSLVVRNSGGTGGIEKVIAAEQLGLEIIMIARPSMPKARRVETVQEALDTMEAFGWLAG